MNQNIRETYKPNRLHRFGLTHFKSFNETAFLPIQPITVLAGLNSSGKSSVIDALLLLKQTLLAEKRVAERIILDWTGPFFEVDIFSEMVYDKDYDGDFTLSFEVFYSVHSQHLQNEHIKAHLPSNIDRFFVRVDFKFGYFKHSDEQHIEPDILLTAFSEMDKEPFIKLRIISSPWIEVAELYNSKNEIIKSADLDSAIDFSYFLPVWEERENLITSPDEKERFEIYTVYRDLFQPAIQTIQDELLYHLKYLGPLREAPQRNYRQKHLRGDDVGAKGEDAVLLLQRYWTRQVEFVELPQNEGKIVSWEKLRPVKMSLGQAVNEALRWLGMQKLKPQKHFSSIQANFATLSNEDTWVTIADVGFGVSQILPVLTHGLLSDTDSLLIFEQPEIHLHPRAQARLGELLVCLARTGRRIIIETHSDHLINRLRRVVAEDLSDQLSNLVSIVFVQPPHLKEGAKLEPLRVNEEGIIENWPPGFLAETAEDSKAIVKAQIRKRQASPSH